MHRHCLQTMLVRARSKDLIRCGGREARAEVPPELGPEQGDALGPAAAMPDRVLDRHLLGGLATPEHYLDGVADGALRGVEVVRAETRVLPHAHAIAEPSDVEVSSHVRLVVRRCRF